MQKHKPLSYIFFIFSLFYAPVLNPYFPKTHFGAGVPDFGLVEISLILWLLVLALDFMLQLPLRAEENYVGPWLFILGCYTMIVIFSVLWSQETYSAANVRDLFFTVLLPFIFVFLARYYVCLPDVITGMVCHAMLSCTLLSIISIAHFVIYQGSDIHELRAGFGGLANPNAMAIFLVMNIPVILYGLYKGLCGKKFGLLVLFLITFGICGTISRKGFVTFGMSYLIFLFLSKRYKLLILCVFLFAMMTAVVVSQRYMSQRYTRASINKEFTGKWNMTLAGVDMFRKKPLYGWGYKGYYNNFGRYFKYAVRKKYNAHNNYITALADYGLLGFIPFLGIFIYPIMVALRNIWTRQGMLSNKSLSAIALLAMLLPFMTSAWFAGKLMYQPVIIDLLYVYIVLFLCQISNCFTELSGDVDVLRE